MMEWETFQQECPASGDATYGAPGFKTRCPQCNQLVMTGKGRSAKLAKHMRWRKRSVTVLTDVERAAQLAEADQQAAKRDAAVMYRSSFSIWASA